MTFSGTSGTGIISCNTLQPFTKMTDSKYSTAQFVFILVFVYIALTPFCISSKRNSAVWYFLQTLEMDYRIYCSIVFLYLYLYAVNVLSGAGIQNILGADRQWLHVSLSPATTKPIHSHHARLLSFEENFCRLLPVLRWPWRRPWRCCCRAWRDFLRAPSTPSLPPPSSPPPPCSPPWRPHRSSLTMFLMLMLLLAGVWVLPLVVLIYSICSRSWCWLCCCALRPRTAPRRCCTPGH